VSENEQREPGNVESLLLGRLLRRTVGWPGLLAAERPRRIRLQRRAEAGRRPLVEAVARRWAVARGADWPGGRRLPLAVVRVPRMDRVSTEPVAREPAVERPATVAPADRARPTVVPMPTLAPPPPPPPPIAEPPAGAETEPRAPRVVAADAPPPPATLSVPLLRRLAGPPAAPRPPLRAEARGDRLAPALARRAGPPTRRDTAAARPSPSEAMPVAAATPVAPSPVALAPTERVRAERPSATHADVGAPAARVGSTTPPPAAASQPTRVRARSVPAPVVLGAAPRSYPRPPSDTTVPAPTTAEIFEWPVLVPFAVGAELGAPPATPQPPAPVERTVAPPARGGVSLPLGAAPSHHAPWPARALPLARPAAPDRPAVDARTEPTVAPAPPAARMPHAGPLSADARPPTAGTDPLARVEPRRKPTKTSRLADEVYNLIVRRLEDERMRRGL
jgi:hypothetical protein